MQRVKPAVRRRISILKIVPVKARLCSVSRAGIAPEDTGKKGHEILY
jgi:hypothetical protein